MKIKIKNPFADNIESVFCLLVGYYCDTTFNSVEELNGIHWDYRFRRMCPNGVKGATLLEDCAHLPLLADLIDLVNEEHVYDLRSYFNFKRVLPPETRWRMFLYQDWGCPYNIFIREYDIPGEIDTDMVVTISDEYLDVVAEVALSNQIHNMLFR